VKAAAKFDIAALAGMTAEEIAASPHISDDMLREFAEIARWETEYPKECRTDLLKLTRYGMPDPEHPHSVEHSRYVAASAHRLMAEAFETVLQGKCLRLIIFGAAADREVHARQELPRRARRALPMEAPHDGHVQPDLRRRVRR
jgi:hypothetical protein